tara:strand:- start:15456 stop:15695 length:240 start_codon:yes stop_codon:yes gene_type:complete
VNKKNETCFSKHKNLNKSCQDKSCRQWMNCENKLNCAIIAAKDGPRTLQEIGDLHGLTRMRICQIEKIALKKIKLLYQE